MKLLKKLLSWLVILISSLAILWVIFALIFQHFLFGISETRAYSTEIREKYHLPTSIKINPIDMRRRTINWAKSMEEKNLPLPEVPSPTESDAMLNKMLDKFLCEVNNFNWGVGKMEMLTIQNDEDLRKHYLKVTQKSSVNSLMKNIEKYCEEKHPSPSIEIKELGNEFFVSAIQSYLKELKKWQTTYYPDWDLTPLTDTELEELREKAMRNLPQQFPLAPTPTLR